MATTVSAHQLAAFTTPENGTSPIDADEVTTNDNGIRTNFNAHDADTGIHVQSSVLGSRPSAGTAGRKWLSVDQATAPTIVKLWYDDGTNWYEATYLPSAGGTLTGDLAVQGAITITDGVGFDPQLTVEFDGSNSLSVRVGVDGAVTMASAGTNRSLTLNFASGITIPGGLISYGANDSGGSGFRTVLVPNA